MRSRANFRTHPLHAMLVPFPLAFLWGGFIADLVAGVTGTVDLRVVAWYLLAAGIIMGLAAAVPSLIDYLMTVPPDSSGKRRATKHLLVNLGALVLFAFAWWLRGGPGVAPDGVLIVTEAVGALLITFGGWMGGTLVYRNQIGVDHRYARAGKWNEVRIDSGDIAARPDELEVDQMKLLRLGGRRIVLARTEDGYVAFSDRCTHKGGSLAGGVMACGTVICPWHGSQFDVRTGTARAGPAEDRIATFRVDTAPDGVRVRLEEFSGE